MHTIRSHGTTVARTHMHDWFILLFLMCVEIILNIIHPFNRFVGKDMMSDLKYPLKDNTVSLWTVPIYAVLLPIIVFSLFYIPRRSVYDLHHSILGLLSAVLITGVLTDSIKNAVGRPRPDLLLAKKYLYDQFGNVACHGITNEIREGRKSFPSGHASWSFAGLGFLSLYLAGKLKAFDEKGNVAKICTVLLPLLVAALVCVSRVDDYWHHWQDVFAGDSWVRLVMATICYLQFFPPPYHTMGWGPYAHFDVVGEARSTQFPITPVNDIEMHVTQSQAARTSEFVTIPLGHNSSSMLNELQAKKM
ncbi:putative lipid phosphate phosphatase 3, chloroplastic [Daucus carota subsp. sativus]|uniref:putative lipid phosphate phosphatase 3, chloroplastic n=1 Tax=Daucus carota subsp. sativus TaxID=79200 RepID=UPI003083D32F